MTASDLEHSRASILENLHDISDLNGVTFLEDEIQDKLYCLSLKHNGEWTLSDEVKYMDQIIDQYFIQTRTFTLQPNNWYLVSAEDNEWWFVWNTPNRFYYAVHGRLLPTEGSHLCILQRTLKKYGAYPIRDGVLFLPRPTDLCDPKG